MRLILKIIFAPFIVILTLFVWICAMAFRCSAFVFGLAGTLVGILGVAVLITYSVKNGIILLVIAFLVSPLGIPMAAAWTLGQMQRLRYAIQDKVYR
ncbi:MAG: CD1845 family protein [Clostridiaceae bacterium]|nr:CD1845 family protein [Clostridiaceae bacterium]